MTFRSLNRFDTSFRAAITFAAGISDRPDEFVNRQNLAITLAICLNELISKELDENVERTMQKFKRNVRPSKVQNATFAAKNFSQYLKLFLKKFPAPKSRL